MLLTVLAVGTFSPLQTMPPTTTSPTSSKAISNGRSLKPDFLRTAVPAGRFAAVPPCGLAAPLGPTLLALLALLLVAVVPAVPGLELAVALLFVSFLLAGCLFITSVSSLSLISYYKFGT
jgi:hypothetical protein